MRPGELFFSHAHADRAFAQRVFDALGHYGVPTWFAPRQIRGAQQWHDEIGKALARCSWFAVLLSPHSVESKWVKRELLYALRNERYNEHIVPLIMADCDPDQLSWTLGNLHHIDFRDDFSSAISDLLRIWGISQEGMD